MQNTAKLQVSVLCEDTELARAFVAQVTDTNIRFGFYKSVSEFVLALHRLEQVPTGLVVDLDLSISSSMQERELLKEVLQKKFPTVFLNLSAGIHFSLRDPRNYESWQRFIGNCQSVQEANKRKYPRMRAYCPVVISTPNSSIHYRVFTGDLSAGGCFIMSADTNQPVGTEVQLRIADIENPFNGRIAWVRPLKRGKQEEPPGYGIEIKFNTDDERKAYSAIL